MGTESHEVEESTVALATTASQDADADEGLSLGPSLGSATSWRSRAAATSPAGAASGDRRLGGTSSTSGYGFARDSSFGGGYGGRGGDRGDSKPHHRSSITRGPPCDLRGSGADTEKHALEHTWVLWFDNLLRQREGGGTWFENLAQVAIFNTVEDFWAVMNHIRSASDLENGANYHFFKEGVKPMWEDEANKGGGKWQFTIYDESQRSEQLWESLLLAMIGEMLGSDDIVDCVRGAVFAKRKTVKAQKKGPRISLWLGKNTEEGYLAIGQRLREALSLPVCVELEFTEHEGAEAVGHSSGGQSTLTC